jgi:hypothetical protein
VERSKQAAVTQEWTSSEAYATSSEQRDIKARFSRVNRTAEEIVSCPFISRASLLCVLWALGVKFQLRGKRKIKHNTYQRIHQMSAHMQSVWTLSKWLPNVGESKCISSGLINLLFHVFFPFFPLATTSHNPSTKRLSKNINISVHVV